MNKQELIEKYERKHKSVLVDYQTAKILAELWGDIKQLDEPQKVTVPQFVANFITEQKKLGHTLSYSIDACMSDRVAEWYWDNSELFARAWLDGYEVEKEKRYYVRMKGVVDNLRLLRHNSPTNTWTIGSEEQCFNVSRAHTRKELEAADFGWVFDCPGIEVEEVEG